MQGFTEKIVGLMKAENLFESQGGPIILSQVCVLCLFASLAFFLLFSFLASCLIFCCQIMQLHASMCWNDNKLLMILWFKKKKGRNLVKCYIFFTLRHAVHCTVSYLLFFIFCFPWLCRLRMSMAYKVSYLVLLVIIIWHGLQIWPYKQELEFPGWCARKMMPRIQW